MTPKEELIFLFEIATKYQLHYFESKLIFKGVATQEIKDCYTKIKQCNDIRIDTVPDIAALNSGAEIEFSISTPKKNTIYFFPNFAEFITKLFNISNTKIPQHFVIYDESLILDSNCDRDMCKHVRAGINLQNFIHLLEKNDIADKISNCEHIIRSVESKILINTTNIDSNNIKSNADILIDSINQISIQLQNEQYKDEKSVLLKNILVTTFKSIKEDIRWNHFISHSKEISDSFSHNVELFITGFKFEDEKEKLLSEIRNFQTALTSTLSGIQSQLFAIPISITIFISQIKYDATTKYITLINSSIVLAATMVFVISLSMLHIQKKTLKTIHDELKQKRERYESGLSECYKTLKPNFDKLEKFHKRNQQILLIIRCFSIISFLTIVLLCSWFTPRTHCYTVNKLPTFIQKYVSNVDLKSCSSQTVINTTYPINKTPTELDSAKAKHQVKVK